VLRGGETHTLTAMQYYPLIFAIAVLVIVVAALSSNWVLGPLRQAGAGTKCPIQFRVSDLLCLFVLIQLPVGTVSWITGGEMTRRDELGIQAVVAIFAILLWWDGIRILSRVGVNAVWRRCVVLVVVLPGLFLGMLAVVAMPLIAFIVHPLLLLTEIPVIGALYAFGCFTRATAASARKDREPPKEIVM
jgi:hypothetical protein